MFGLTAQILESCAVPEEGSGTNFGPGLRWEPKFDHGTWDVWIEHQPQFKTYTVHAQHQETTARCDHDAPYRSLGKARDRAGRLATVLRGTAEEFDWRARAVLGPKKKRRAVALYRQMS